MELNFENYPYLENLVNSLTHGVGVLLFLVLCPMLIATAVLTNYRPKISGSVIFSFGLLAVYFSSTIYHALPEKMSKHVLNYFDLLSIYLLISGTYTPFLLIYFRSKWGKAALIMLWAVTAIGMTSKIVISHMPFFYTLLIYLIMGWVGVFMIRPAFLKIKPRVLWLLGIGGVLYTAGTYFIYHDDKVWYYHAIWHVFVLVASICHFWAVYLAIIDKKR